jgi:hypothetical protein
MCSDITYGSVYFLHHSQKSLVIVHDQTKTSAESYWEQSHEC